MCENVELRVCKPTRVNASLYVCHCIITLHCIYAIYSYAAVQFLENSVLTKYSELFARKHSSNRYYDDIQDSHGNKFEFIKSTVDLYILMSTRNALIILKIFL